MTQAETLELLVATLQQTNANLSESIRKLTRQNEQLQNKLDELLAQVAWLNRQLFGRKSEKLSRLDPNQLWLLKRKNGRTVNCWKDFRLWKLS